MFMILLTSFIFNFAKVGFRQGIEYFHIILGNAMVLKMLLEILEHKSKRPTKQPMTVRIDSKYTSCLMKTRASPVFCD